MANRYPGRCHYCSRRVDAGAGISFRRGDRWRVAHGDCAPAPTAPPAGDHDGWHRRPAVALDLETTSAEPADARIVTASVVRVDGNTRTWVVDPGVPIPPEATAINGITDEYVRQHGASPESALGEIAGELAEVIAAGIPLVAFNASFDCSVLRAELARHRLPALDWDRACVIDPAVLDKQVDRWRRGSRRLDATCAFYGVELRDAHRSAADAMAALLLARAIGARHAELAAMTTRDLHRAQVSWYAADKAGLQQYFHRTGRTDVVDTGWPLQD